MKPLTHAFIFDVEGTLIDCVTLIIECWQRVIQHVRPLPGVGHLFEWLNRNGHRSALATTSQPDELQYYLKLLEITDDVTAVVCGDEVEEEKPAPNLIEAALKKLPASYSEVIVVGDTPYDAQAAQRVGAIALGMLTGGFSRDELLEAGCKDVATDPAHLLRVLARQDHLSVP